MPTGIDYLDESWNPVTGCTPVSAGCGHCWAKKMATRLKGRYGYPSEEPFRPGVFHVDKIAEPESWKKPRRVGVCFMGDLFHQTILPSTIWNIIRRMRAYDWHTYFLLTKRAKRMSQILQRTTGYWPLDNVWVGVSAENQKWHDERVGWLFRAHAMNRWLSLEPLFTPVKINLIEAHVEYRMSINWVVAGCESGPSRRHAELDWFRDIRDQCWAKGVPLWIKQLSINGRVSHNPEEWPQDLRVREHADEPAVRLAGKDA